MKWLSFPYYPLEGARYYCEASRHSEGQRGIAATWLEILYEGELNPIKQAWLTCHDCHERMKESYNGEDTKQSGSDRPTQRKAQ